jgi:hypothetical protein
MIRNIHNLMTDLMEMLEMKESSVSWDYEVERDIGYLVVRLPQGTFPPGIRVPKMVCKIQFSRETANEGQICFLEENTLFQQAIMGRILDFFAANTVEV